MKQGKISQPIFKRNDSRGTFEEVINFGNWKNFIFGKMKKGAKMGYHYHRKTFIFFYLISGKAEVKILNLKTRIKSKCLLLPNQGYVFLPEEVRIIKYLKNSQFAMIKSKRFNQKKPDLISFKNKF